MFRSKIWSFQGRFLVQPRSVLLGVGGEESVSRLNSVGGVFEVRAGARSGSRKSA